MSGKHLFFILASVIFAGITVGVFLQVRNGYRTGKMRIKTAKINRATQPELFWIMMILQVCVVFVFFLVWSIALLGIFG